MTRGAIDSALNRLGIEMCIRWAPNRLSSYVPVRHNPEPMRLRWTWQ